MKLLDELRQAIRIRHYSRATEQTYVGWTKRYLRFHAADGKWRHPREMSASEVEAFLTHLAVAGRVAASTQNQALNAIIFLYRHVLDTNWATSARSEPGAHVACRLCCRVPR